jgi:hypothetical protein
MLCRGRLERRKPRGGPARDVVVHRAHQVSDFLRGGCGPRRARGLGLELEQVGSQRLVRHCRIGQP